MLVTLMDFEFSLPEGLIKFCANHRQKQDVQSLGSCLPILEVQTQHNNNLWRGISTCWR